MRRVLLACLILVAAIVLQLTLVNGLPLPGGSPPDLVLVVVAALAVTGGPLEGALTGFAGGLALDIAPPAAHLVGRDALVFCLVGYGVGLLAGSLEHTAWLRLAAVALGAAAGEGLLAAVGVMFSEADITWSTARQVLPAALLYELALAPFVLEAVTRLRGWAGAEAGYHAAVGGELAAIAAAAATPLAALAGTRETVRSTGTGRQPRLRAAAGRSADGWIGSHPRSPGAGGGAAPRRKPLNLRLRGGQAGSAAAIVTRAAVLPARPVSLRLGSRRRGDRVSAGVARSAARAQGKPAQPRGPRAGGSTLRAGAFRGGPSASRPATAAAKPLNLRLGSRRRGDGVVGTRFLGGVWGGRPPGLARSWGGRSPRLARFGGSAGGRSAGLAPLSRGGSPGRGPARRRSAATPRFGGGGLGRKLGRRGGLGSRGGLGGRGGGGLTGMLPGGRAAGSPRLGRSRARPWRRWQPWRKGGLR